MDNDPLKCPRCGEVTPGDPDPDVPEYADEVCDSCSIDMADNPDDPTI